MGTRSITHLLDENGAGICTIYRQYDGYPGGHGVDVRDFISDVRVVNGIGGNGRVFNGAADLAAQLVCHLKHDDGGNVPEDAPRYHDGSPIVGNIYLYPPGASDMGEEYVYHVWPEAGKAYMSCRALDGTTDGVLLYAGPAADWENIANID